MKYSLPALFMGALLLLSCSEHAPEQELIDYATLPLIELNKEFTISESDDYLPVNVTQLMLTEEGNILVSQRMEAYVHLFDSLGNYMEQVAGPGRGPGELGQYALANLQGNVLIMSNNDAKISEFRKKEDGTFDFITDHVERLPGYFHYIRSGDSFSDFYLSRDSVNYPYTDIPPEYIIHLTDLATFTEDSLEIQQSLFTLRKHSSYIESFDNGRGRRYITLPYRYQDNFQTLTDKKILISRAGKSTLEIYDSTFTLEQNIKLNIKVRPFSEEDIEHHFPDLSRTEINKRMELIEDNKPPFTGVIPDHAEHFLLQTDDTAEGNEYVLINYEGEALGKFLLPSNNTVHAFRNNKIYTIQDPYGLPEIKVYSLDM